jgi:superfamily II DNA/RNA helicase
MDKDEVIARIPPGRGTRQDRRLTRTKRAAAKLVEELNDRGFNAAAVHGDFTRSSKARKWQRVKARQRKTSLIATDVAARGIDAERRYQM